MVTKKVYLVTTIYQVSHNLWNEFDDEMKSHKDLDQKLEKVVQSLIYKLKSNT